MSFPAATASAQREEATARAPAPWHIAQLFPGDRELLEQLDGVEVFAPTILRLARVPHRQLSRSQRMAAANIAKPKPVPLLPGFVFLRGLNWWRLPAGFRGGLASAGEDRLPVEIPPAIVDRLQAYATAGAVPADITVARLLGLNDDLQDVLAAKVADVEPSILVRVIVAQARA